jgi:hypothetical protein
VNQILLWISLAAGLLVVFKALTRSRWPLSSAPEHRRVELAAFVLVAGGAALTLLKSGPFSSGQTLWAGLLLGAVVTLLGSAVARPAGGGATTEEARIDAWGGRFGAAAAGLALLLLPYSAQALDVLSGYALGALAVAILFVGTLRFLSPDDELTRARCAGAEATALLVATLAAADYLATFHRGPTGLREWQALPALLTAAAGLLLSVRALVGAPAGRGWLYSLGLVGVPLVVIAWLMAARLNGSLPFLWVVLLGFGLFALISGLDAVSTAGDEPDATAGSPMLVRLIAALLVIGGGVIAFRELHGFGLALLVLAGWVAYAAFGSGRAPAIADRSMLSSALGFGLIIALYRVFVERNEYTRGFQADFLYYYAALLIGALLPALLTGLATSRRSATTSAWGAAFSRMALAGVLAGLAPLAVWMLIGDRPEAALLVGLGVAALGVSGTTATEEARGASALQRLLGPTLALSAVQFTHLMAPLALRTRGQRLEILVGVTVAVLVGIGLTTWWEQKSGARS